MSDFDNRIETSEAWFVLEPMAWEEVTRADRLHGSPVMPLPHPDQRTAWELCAGTWKRHSGMPGASRASVLLSEAFELVAAEPGSANQLDEAAQVIAGVLRLIAEQNHREREADE